MQSTNLVHKIFKVFANYLWSSHNSSDECHLFVFNIISQKDGNSQRKIYIFRENMVLFSNVMKSLKPRVTEMTQFGVYPMRLVYVNKMKFNIHSCVFCDIHILWKLEGFHYKSPPPLQPYVYRDVLLLEGRNGET